MATSDKYDRQLRLWGANGQRALMNAHVLLINADATGTETLKNLVLPGVSQFTILDDHVIDAVDVQSNFFVTHDVIGQPRATVTKDNLLEMNPDVSGHSRTDSVGSLLKTDKLFFAAFSVVICSNLAPNLALLVSDICWKNKIPLVMTRSVGMIGYYRFQTVNHDIVESKPENELFEMSIDKPFKELQDYCDNIQLEELNSNEHSHIPYVVILVKVMQLWKKQQNTEMLPKTFAEKESFKVLIKETSRNFDMELNFREAHKEAYRAYTTSSAVEVVELLEEQKDVALGSDRTELSVLLKAVQLYSIKTGGNSKAIQWSWPSRGKIPDMTASTALFIGLQQVYHAKAIAELKQFTEIVHELMGPDVISTESIELFCKNIAAVCRVSTSNLCDEYGVCVVDGQLSNAESSASNMCMDTIKESLQDLYEDDAAQTPLFWYMALRGLDKYFLKHGRLPLWEDDSKSMAKNVDGVWEEIQSLWGSLPLRATPSPAAAASEGIEGSAMMVCGSSSSAGAAVSAEVVLEEVCEVVYGEVSMPASHLLSKDHINELLRACAGAARTSELHTIAAIIGGTASQEIVKILTRQFVPLNNTFIYNGVAGVSATYSF